MRAYKNKDYPCLIALLKEHFEKALGLEFSEEFFQEQLGKLSPTNVIYVEEQDKKVIAFIWVYCRNHKGRIKHLIVTEPYQGKGIGTKLMEWALDYFQKQGMRLIDLKVNIGNDPAIALYKKFGFSATKMIMEKKITDI